MRGSFIIARTIPKGYGISRIFIEKGSDVSRDVDRV